MTDARSAILAAIRPTGAKPIAANVKAEADALLTRVAATRPDRVGPNPAESFLARLTAPAVGATAQTIASLADLPTAIRQYLANNNLPINIALQPDPTLTQLAWGDITHRPTIAPDETTAVSLALGGIAETGSLVLHSSPTAPTLFAFLPLHHIVAVRASSLWHWLEDYARAAASLPIPRNANLITGASGTTDIEGALVRGAHGPGWLHVILITNE